jgi:hypothetical protein
MATVVPIPFDTIDRVLERATTPPGRASDVYGGTRDSPEPPPNPPPVLTHYIVDALRKADQDEVVGEEHTQDLVLPQPGDFAVLVDWCRAVKMDTDADVIVTAVTRSTTRHPKQ